MIEIQETGTGRVLHRVAADTLEVEAVKGPAARATGQEGRGCGHREPEGL